MLDNLTIVREWPETRKVLLAWRAGNGFRRQLIWWVLIAGGIACALLGLTYLIGSASTPDPSAAEAMSVPSDMAKDRAGYFWHIVTGNMLVLALHACACLAGYIAHVALPDELVAEDSLHAILNRLGALVAMVFVPFATLFSIATQAWVQGSRLQDLATLLQLDLGVMLLTVVPHALPELTAVFLPLAAWLFVSATKRWEELLAATIITVVIAIPVILVSAVVEVVFWPTTVATAREHSESLRYLGVASENGKFEFGASVTELWAVRLTDTEYDGADSALAAAAEASRDPANAGVAVISVPDRMDRYRIYRLTGARLIGRGKSDGTVVPERLTSVPVDISPNIPWELDGFTFVTTNEAVSQLYAIVASGRVLMATRADDMRVTMKLRDDQRAAVGTTAL